MQEVALRGREGGRRERRESVGQRREDGGRRRKSGKNRKGEGGKERGCVDGRYIGRKEGGDTCMPKDNSFFPREKMSWIRTCNILHTMQMLYQLSHQGSSAGQAKSLKFLQGKGHLSPDGQGNSNSVVRSTSRGKKWT